MSKILKRILASACILTLMLSMTACGGKKTDDTAQNTGKSKEITVMLPPWAELSATLLDAFTTWNQFQIPLILAPSNATKPIAVVISEFVTKSTVNYGLMNAGGIIAIIPPAAIAVIFRKSLIRGIVGGATKG